MAKTATKHDEVLKGCTDALLDAVKALPDESPEGVSLVQMKTDVLARLEGPAGNPQLGVVNMLQALAKLAS